MAKRTGHDVAKWSAGTEINSVRSITPTCRADRENLTSLPLLGRVQERGRRPHFRTIGQGGLHGDHRPCGSIDGP